MSHWSDLISKCTVEDLRQNGNISSWRPPGSVRSPVKCWISLPKLRKGLKPTRRLRDQQTAAAQSCSVFSHSQDAAWTDWLLSLFLYLFFHQRVLLSDCYKKKAQSDFFFFFFTSYKFLELILLMWKFFMQQFLSMSIFDLGIYFILTPQCCKVLAE